MTWSMTATAGSPWPSPGQEGAVPLGHLPAWSRDPLALLADGARMAPVFQVRLWRRLLVGYRPDWNRLLLGDLDTFRSGGSLSQLSPYLRGGVVALEAPGHRGQRSLMNPAFHRRAVADAFPDLFTDIVARSLPSGDFDAVQWSADVVRQMLAKAFFGPAFPPAVLRSFLAPLNRGFPAPLLPRPIRIPRMTRAVRAELAAPTPGTLGEMFATLPNGVEEARVAIAAGFDTTCHTMAFALWELAGRPELNSPGAEVNVVKEALRLYPSGWIGSRVAHRDVEVDGRVIPCGQHVLYSPYLTHRDPDLWPDPGTFRPDRFEQALPAWGYLPFAAGERSCLGAALASAMLEAAIGGFAGQELSRIGGDARPSGVVTLTPRGRIVLRAEPV